MAKYRCKGCGRIFDDSKEFVRFDEVDDTYMCTWCGAPKSEFEKIEE